MRTEPLPSLSLLAGAGTAFAGDSDSAGLGLVHADVLPPLISGETLGEVCPCNFRLEILSAATEDIPPLPQQALPGPWLLPMRPRGSSFLHDLEDSSEVWGRQDLCERGLECRRQLPSEPPLRPACAQAQGGRHSGRWAAGRGGLDQGGRVVAQPGGRAVTGTLSHGVDGDRYLPGARGVSAR